MEFDTGAGRGEAEEGEGASRGSGVGGPRGGGYDLSDPVNSFIATAREIVTRPVAFFRGVTLRDRLRDPIAFAMICAFIGAFLGGFLGIFAAVVGIGDRGIGGALGGFVAGIILAPLLTPVGLLIGAGISHLFVMLFVRPSNAGYWATFRVFCYVTATSLVSWVPIIGGLVAGVWGIVLSIFGIREMHSTTTGRAALVVLIPIAIVVLLVGFIAFSVLIAFLIGSR